MDPKSICLVCWRPLTFAIPPEKQRKHVDAVNWALASEPEKTGLGSKGLWWSILLDENVPNHDFPDLRTNYLIDIPLVDQTCDFTNCRKL